MGLKSELIQYSKLCGAAGFVKAYDGNLSVRTKKNYILSTASKTNKLKIKPIDLVKCDLKGKKQAGKRNLSTELKLHLYIYNKRKDVNAVIHTHPLYITTFASAGKKLPANILPEIYLMFREIPLAKIVRLIDGPIAMLPCVSLYFYERCKNCDEKQCGLHDMMILVRDANLKILEKKTVADLAKK